MRYCKTKYCSNPLSPAGRSPYCSKCRSRHYRENHKMVSSYHIKKWNAFWNSIPFLITLNEWMEWCQKTSYHLLRGPEAEDMTVDRKDPTKPYTIDNIQMITRRANGVKGMEERKKGKYWPKYQFPDPPDSPPCPF